MWPGACSWPFLTLTPRASILRLGFVLRSLVCFLVRGSVRGWAGIHVGLDPGSDTVSSEAHPSMGGLEQREGLCLAPGKRSGDAYGMTKSGVLSC